jgi:uncharacterized protein (TIGR03437 family)
MQLAPRGGVAVEVYNNTAYKCGTIAASSCFTSSPANLRNNICYQPAPLQYLSGTSGLSCANNLFFGNGSAPSGCSNGAVSANPQLLDLLGFDFHLSAASAAKDAGVAVSGLSADFEGVTRPQGDAPDIGAHEFFLGTQPLPIIDEGGVVNSASFSADGINSPGAIAALFGQNLAAATESARFLPLPLTLASSQVLVNGSPAPLFFASPDQINFQIPDLPTGASSINAQVAVATGGVQSAAVAVPIVAAAPGIFTLSSNGTGQAAVLNQDLSLNSAQNAASPGETIVIYLTGLGTLVPPLLPGAAAGTEPLNRTIVAPTILIDNLPADVLYSGAAPGFAGLYQINAQIPLGVTGGNSVRMEIRAGARTSNVVSIAVR